MLWTVIELIASVFTLAHISRWLLKGFFYKKADITKEIDVRNKIIIVTGANSGVGKYTSYEFAAKDATVILACRDQSRAENAINWIRTKTNLGKLTFMKLDLGSLESIRNFAAEFKKKYDRLDILVNNGGVSLPSNEPRKTVDGFEIHMGVNHLGHFLLTNLLLEPLKKAAPSRIVHVSSSGHILCKLDLDDLMSKHKDNRRNPMPLMPISQLYCRSKRAQVLFNYELSKRLLGTGVNTYTLCPGGVNSDLGRNQSWFDSVAPALTSFFLKTIEEGAATTIHCALNKDLANESGEMYHGCSKWDQNLRPSYTEDETKKLWEVSAKYVGL